MRFHCLLLAGIEPFYSTPQFAFHHALDVGLGLRATLTLQSPQYSEIALAGRAREAKTAGRMRWRMVWPSC